MTNVLNQRGIAGARNARRDGVNEKEGERQFRQIQPVELSNPHLPCRMFFGTSSQSSMTLLLACCVTFDGGDLGYATNTIGLERSRLRALTPINWGVITQNVDIRGDQRKKKRTPVTIFDDCLLNLLVTQPAWNRVVLLE